jgi:hypothetical protein
MYKRQPYNIYRNSPQLAYNANQKKYYEYVIAKNNKLFNKSFSNYSPLYYNTSYQSIYRPTEIIMPF